MHSKASTAGVVIAGGRSVRFGGEKAVAMLQGQPLLLRASARLARSCVAVAVNARPGTRTEALARESGLVVLGDAPGDADGPLAGVKAALAWAQSLSVARIVATPCDVPLLPEDLCERLIAAAIESSSGASFAVTEEGRQPLCAVWPVAALMQVTDALRGGAHPATWRLLESLGAATVHFAPAAAFANVNTRDDLAAVEQQLHQR